MSKNAMWALGAIIAVVAIVVGVWWWKQSADTKQVATSVSASPTPSPSPTEAVLSATEGGSTMQSEDEVVGTGEEAVAGKTVTVTYVGTFTNGTQFDASAKHPDANGGFTFTLGAGQVIKGWDEGVVGMKVGGKRRLTIPSDLAYGPKDYNGIPGGSTLIFEIELLKVQ